ncbi:MAG: class I SAM-dependent methyltransferase [Candidatus Thioglobus sp.]|nr:class I SAM-dependent methyltransferase [Candidatus Thioglobus pontius]MBL6977060.1 class I SAM-dependent methyltransferase [Candidatus Thioglobus sp.]MBL6984889.1 class I SAM-dependent methyltransferase [Candidatus Thioglobus sp.]
MTDTFSHWDNVYKTKGHDQVSWHQSHSTISFDWILASVKPTDSIIDVGCGVSILADNLLTEGFNDISLLELSTEALNTLKLRLKKSEKKLSFYNENVLDFQPNNTFKLWHDRAVFHFLTDPKDQQTYLQKLDQYLEKEGFFLLSTFSPDGPKECSNLDIVQYDEAKIVQLLGGKFELIKTVNEKHPHPNGSIQSFNYFLFKKKHD